MCEDPGGSDLVARVVQGDENALERLLLQNYELLLNYIRRSLPARLASQADPEDVVQETHVRAFRSMGQFRGTSLRSFQAWLKTIADNHLRNVLRDAARQRRSGDRVRVRYADAGQGSLVDLVQILSARDRNPRSDVAVKEAVQAVQVGLAHLPNDQRRAIELRYLLGKDVPETATAMEKSPGAVRGLLQRGKLQLKDMLGRSSRWLSNG